MNANFLQWDQWNLWICQTSSTGQVCRLVGEQPGEYDVHIKSTKLPALVTHPFGRLLYLAGWSPTRVTHLPNHAMD